MEYWNSVTDAQATIIAALLTILAAVLGVLLGAWLFGGRVKSLESALKKTEDRVAEFRKKVEDQLSAIEPQVGSLLKLAQEVRASVDDLDNSQPVPEPDAAAPATRANLKVVWQEIRDVIDSIASDQDVDGRTRARFARIERYSYEDLINALAEKELLGEHRGDFLRANAIWQNYQRRPDDPRQAEFDEIRELRDRLAPLARE